LNARLQAVVELHRLVSRMRAATPADQVPAFESAIREVPLEAILLHIAANDPDLRDVATSLLGDVMAYDIGWGDVMGSGGLPS